MNRKLFYVTAPAQLLVALFSAPSGPDAYLASDPESELVTAALAHGYRWVRTDQIDGQSIAILEAQGTFLTR